MIYVIALGLLKRQHYRRLYSPKASFVIQIFLRRGRSTMATAEEPLLTATAQQLLSDLQLSITDCSSNNDDAKTISAQNIFSTGSVCLSYVSLLADCNDLQVSLKASG